MGTIGAGAARERTRLPVWIATAVLAAAGVAGFAIVDRPPAQGFGTAAEAMLPSDGDAALLELDDGTRWVVETARTIGPSAVLAQPPLPGELVLDAIDAVEGGDSTYTRFVRFLSTRIDGDPGAAATPRQIVELASADADGLRLRTVTGTENGFVYSPGLLLLPADVGPGATWSSEGDALPYGLLRYRYEASAADAGDGCLLVTSTTVYLDPDASDPRAAELSRIEERSTWCPGRGIVASTVTSDGASTTLVARPFAGGSILPVLDSAGAGAWHDPAGWVATQPESTIVDPLFGESTLTRPIAGPAAVTRAVDGSHRVRAWTARPGGSIVSLGAIGELVLAGTSDRRVVAYTSAGARAWTTDFDDVVLDPPVADGRGGLVAVALDGEVRSVTALGETAWSFALGADAEAALQVADGVVLAGARDGRVVALDAADGALRWSVTTDPAIGLVVAGDLLVVAHAGGGATALDLATGERRWSDEDPGEIERLVAVGDVVVAMTADGLVAWDATDADGGVAWRIPGASLGLVSDGRTAVALTDDSVLALAADGTTLGAWPIRSAGLALSRVLLAGPDGVLVVDGDHELVALGLP